VLKLSDLMHAGVKDLVPGSPFDGQQLTAGSIHSITWRTIGEVDRVDLEYRTDKEWISIATGIANSDIFEWTVPNVLSQNVKIRVRDTNGNVVGESQGYFEITGAATNKLP